MADGECVNNEGWRDTENLNVKDRQQWLQKPDQRRK